jgi:hypothetical protein
LSQYQTAEPTMNLRYLRRGNKKVLQQQFVIKTFAVSPVGDYPKDYPGRDYYGYELPPHVSRVWYDVPVRPEGWE